MLGSFLSSYRGLDRRIALLAAARAINTMGFSIVMPFLAMYLVEKRGASGALSGMVYLFSGICAAAGNALSGEASDRFGRRPMLIAALLLRAGNMALLGLAVMSDAPVWVLGGLVVVNGVLRSLFDPAASAAVTELAPPGRRAAAFGLQRIGVNVGWALGPALGGALAGAHSYGALFFVSAGIMLAAAGAVATVKGIGGGGGPAELAPASVRGAGGRAFSVYLALVLLGAMMTVQIFLTLSLYARTELGLSQQAIGLLYTVNGVLVVVLQVPAVVFIERGGPRRALIIGPLVYCAAFVAVGLSGRFIELALAMALLTAGEVIFAPALSDMAAHLGDARHMGRAFGLFGLMQQLGVSLGPLVGGIIYDHLRHRHLAMWGTIAAGMAAIGAGYALFAAKVLSSRTVK